ncbi:hypothetical protein ANCDUO_19966 [Ancylostoma duodenale]|uniref:Uncharacterized protein n=1 Tax=Ancylostoma duodenale TaxID=51022 RepID=A0A0C2C139_9BILA|nr:hypothetical protein ANCDUO_19966 [Ancylostoma duodenale]
MDDYAVNRFSDWPNFDYLGEQNFTALFFPHEAVFT